MPNIFTIIKIRRLIVLLAALTLPAHSIAGNSHKTIDAIEINNTNKISLTYSPKLRKIWLENKKQHIYKLVNKLEKNSNQELVGSEGSIRFVTRSVLQMQGKSYIGLIISERSMRRNSQGQCGAGSEEHSSLLNLKTTTFW